MFLYYIYSLICNKTLAFSFNYIQKCFPVLLCPRHWGSLTKEATAWCPSRPWGQTGGRPECQVFAPHSPPLSGTPPPHAWQVLPAPTPLALQPTCLGSWLGLEASGPATSSQQLLASLSTSKSSRLVSIGFARVTDACRARNASFALHPTVSGLYRCRKVFVG